MDLADVLITDDSAAEDQLAALRAMGTALAPDHTLAFLRDR